MPLTLASPKTIIQKDILMTIETAMALQKARGKNRGIHPGNYLEHHLAKPLATRRAEAATNHFECLVLRLNPRESQPNSFQTLNMNIWHLD